MAGSIGQTWHINIRDNGDGTVTVSAQSPAHKIEHSINRDMDYRGLWLALQDIHQRMWKAWTELDTSPTPTEPASGAKEQTKLPSGWCAGDPY